MKNCEEMHSRTKKDLKHITLPSPLEWTGEMETNWSVFKQKFENFLLINKEDVVDSSYKNYLLLSCIGDRALEIYNTFPFKTPNHRNDFKFTIDQFDIYFSIKRNNVAYERNKFFLRELQANESIDDFVIDLRKLSDTCEFREQKEDLIRDKLILCTRNIKVKNVLFSIDDLTLNNAIEVCRFYRNQLQDSYLGAIGSSLEAKEEQSKSLSLEDKNLKLPSNRSNRPFENLCQRCGLFHKIHECPANESESNESVRSQAYFENGLRKLFYEPISKHGECSVNKSASSHQSTRSVEPFKNLCQRCGLFHKNRDCYSNELETNESERSNESFENPCYRCGLFHLPHDCPVEKSVSKKVHESHNFFENRSRLSNDSQSLNDSFRDRCGLYQKHLDCSLNESVLNESQRYDESFQSCSSSLNKSRNSNESSKTSCVRCGDLHSGRDCPVNDSASESSQRSKTLFFANPCWRCGIYHDMNRCPAYGKTCFRCKQLNHYGKQCHLYFKNE
uniref:CCHC-type domain-containing protein n=1 Tax=Clastoptera arizonana TaxID=38151 RepID=A0A1B6CDU3_9HEMI